jgi:hypothetical protein
MLRFGPLELVPLVPPVAVKNVLNEEVPPEVEKTVLYPAEPPAPMVME